MATVGSVLAALAGLDSSLPVGALRVDRHGEVTAFELGDVSEVHVEHRPESGRPRAAWVIVGVPSDATREVLFNAAPSWWTAHRAGCGCVLAIPVLPGRSVATFGVACAHFAPSRVDSGLAGPRTVVQS